MPDCHSYEDDDAEVIDEEIERSDSSELVCDVLGLLLVFVNIVLLESCYACRIPTKASGVFG